MKPTPTPEMIEAAKKALVKYSVLMPVDAAISDAISAALSVPAAAVVGEPAIEHAEWLEACATNEPSQNDAEKLWTCAQLIRTVASRISQQDAELELLREALKPFALAATIFEQEYGARMKPDTGCNIKFAVLCQARAALRAKAEETKP